MKPIQSRLKGHRYLALAAALISYLLIVAGGIVRVTGSSLACPDWPTCYGQWLPPLEFGALVEYSHRLLTIFSIPLVLFAAYRAWRQFRAIRLIYWPMMAAVVVLIAQALLGGLVVLSQVPADLVALHLGLALLMLAFLITATVKAFVLYQDPEQKDRLRFSSPFGRSTLIALLGLFIVLVSGAYVSVSDATYACSGWPLCNGELIPSHPLGWVNMAHRALVGLGSIFMLVLLRNAWRSQRSQRGILSAATLTVVLYFSQAFVGALKVSDNFPAYLLGLHEASSGAVWAAAAVTVILVGLANRSQAEEEAEAAIEVDKAQRTRDFIALTKPLIVVLLLVTTYAGMVVGARELPSLSLTFWTLVGGALAAGGAGAVNQYIDRELDQRMTRTAKRPLASGRMTPAEGLAFSLALLVISFYLYMGFVNMLAALLSLAGMIYYIFIYSVWLKRATVQNIVIGGGAGAIPPMVGWAAATGRLDLTALFLFAIIFMWTPPHFWALALVRQKDYAKAGVPMLPVVRGEQHTRWQIFLYTIELVALTLVLPLLDMAGNIYLFSAALLGGLLIYAAWKVWRVGGNAIAWRMYRYSSMYLAFLFVALVADALFY